MMEMSTPLMVALPTAYAAMKCSHIAETETLTQEKHAK
jgi:hypothetical protein